MLELFKNYTLPLDDWIQAAIKEWLVTNYRWLFQDIKIPVEVTLRALDDFLNWVDPSVVLVAVFLIGWQTASFKVGLGSALALLLVGFLGVWEATMTTLAMIGASVLFCAAVGIPVGVVAARSDRIEGVIRPLLDAMQTVPPFVYLVPVVMLFSIGNVAGVIATIIFALPPIIRLTNLGIRQVSGDVIEAAYAFGSTPRQVLLEIQVPLALRTIMAGLNQTLMLALSMVVIAFLIGAGGLGQAVIEGLNRLDVGRASVGGIGIVVLAISLDRITQALGRTSTGERVTPVQLVRSLTRLGQPAPTPASAASTGETVEQRRTGARRQR